MSPTKPHWTEFFSNHEDETPKRHWTEYLDNDAEATDRDDWEWDRQDDFGDPWDREDPSSI